MIKATYIDHMGSDLSVVNAARVSFGKKSEAVSWEWPDKKEQTLKGKHMIPVLSDKDTKLIFYLADHKHMSPFGHCFATFHVKAPIFVARQLVKHKFLRWNEISRRYVDDEPEFYEPYVWRGRSEDKKQGSTDEQVNPCDFYGFDSMAAAVNSFDGEQLKLYNDMLAAGVAPEQARMVLPQSTMTEWYWSGSLDAFSDMCVLRCANDTQFETRYVAEQISLKMHELFPISWMALAKGRH